MLEDQHAASFRIDVNPVHHVVRMKRRCTASEEIWGIEFRVLGDIQGLSGIIQVDVVGVEGALGTVGGFVGPVTVFWYSSVS